MVRENGIASLLDFSLSPSVCLFRFIDELRKSVCRSFILMKTQIKKQNQRALLQLSALGSYIILLCCFATECLFARYIQFVYVFVEVSWQKFIIGIGPSTQWIIKFVCNKKQRFSNCNLSVTQWR